MLTFAMTRFQYGFLELGLCYILICSTAHGACSKNDCDPRTNIYWELGCDEVHIGNKTSSYNCDRVFNSYDPKKCNYRGRTYELGQEIPNTRELNVCQFSCYCVEDAVGGRPFITCPVVDCPDFNDGKSHVYSSLDMCCPDAIGNKQDSVKCKYDGRTYLEGEKIYPAKYPCYTCLCDKGFSAEKVPDISSCRRIGCGLEIKDITEIEKYCAPVFYDENSCCPIHWICHTPSDVAISKSSDLPKSEEKKCRYGPMDLAVGDILMPAEESQKYQKVECKCSTPPFVFCVFKKNGN